jgi:hypothetical protein
MTSPSLFCFPLSENCKLMTEWAVYWQAIGTIAAVVFGVAGLWKIYQELRRLNEQREKDIVDKEVSAKLERTKFFLDQHRRLFDNPELYEVLCLIDDDNPKLAQIEMADKKRKFLTFLEEIALLVSSKQIDESVAYYMFGYYATCVKKGKNFAADIDTSKVYWELFYRFAENAEIYVDSHPNGPPIGISL